MIKTISLKLINDEKKKARILSAKACTTDNAECTEGAIDRCYGTDLAGCYGNGSYDYCKYIDAALCLGGARDTCEYDYDMCIGHNEIDAY